MLTRRRTRLEPAATPEWSRQKLLVALSLVAVLAVASLAGVGLWVWFLLHPHPTADPAAAGAAPVPAAAAPFDAGSAGAAAQAAVSARRDALAAAPMRAVDPAAAQPAVLSVRDPGSIDLPAATGPGPVGVPTGFPHTPEGALAQLAAIDTDVLDTDWTVVCVDFEVDATLARTARVAAADCQRMVWDGDRWLVGPGAEPALTPSIWPGTDAAIDAGYRNLRHG